MNTDNFLEPLKNTDVVYIAGIDHTVILYDSNDAECIGLPITLQITARVTWSGWPRIARSHTEISLSLSELLHRGTNLACKRE